MSRQFLLLPWVVSLACWNVSHGAEQPPVVANAMVDKSTAGCTSERMFFLRDSAGYCQGELGAEDAVVDTCSPGYYPPSGQDSVLSYPNPYLEPPEPAYWSATVTGSFWPPNAPGADIQAVNVMYLDSPNDQTRGCADGFRFKQGADDFRTNGFSYFVYDMSRFRGCKVHNASLSFKVSPWFSSSTDQKANPVTAKIGIFDMQHSCENTTQDGKRSCFAPLVNDPANNPIDFQFPHTRTDYEHFSVDVSQSVVADLNDPGASGYVGFMIASRGFGTENFDQTQGIRSVGMYKFILDVDLGTCDSKFTCSPGPLVIPPDTEHTGIETWQSEDTISTNGSVMVLTKGDVIYKAQKSVTLNMEFGVQEGSNFVVDIGNVRCGS